jgi:hypothetical protein
MIYTDLFKLIEDRARSVPALPGDRSLILAALRRYSEWVWVRWSDGPADTREAMQERGRAIDAIIARLEA